MAQKCTEKNANNTPSPLRPKHKNEQPQKLLKKIFFQNTKEKHCTSTTKSEIHLHRESTQKENATYMGKNKREQRGRRPRLNRTSYPYTTKNTKLRVIFMKYHPLGSKAIFVDGSIKLKTRIQ